MDQGARSQKLYSPEMNRSAYGVQMDLTRGAVESNSATGEPVPACEEGISWEEKPLPPPRDP